MIHLIFGRAANGSLKHALRGQDDKVIGFPIDFSVGPIKNIHKESGIQDYFSWLAASYHIMWGSFEEEGVAYQQAMQELLEIKDDEQVTIWTSENASEQIGLRIATYLLKDREVELACVNTFKAMQDYMNDEDVIIEIRHTGECNAEQLRHFYEHASYPISDQMKEGLEQDGKKLLQSTSIVRSWRQGEIIHELETRDDAFILKYAKRLQDEIGNLEYINTIRLVGEVLVHAEYTFSDAWIEYRIRSLIHSGKLVYEGNLKSMRMYKIRVV